MDTTEEILRRYQSGNENVRLALFMNYRELRASFREIDQSTEPVVHSRCQPTTNLSLEGMFTWWWKRLTAIMVGR